MHKPPPAHRFFYLLDGIRGLAALLVVLRHTRRFWGPISFQETYLAVDIFFLLSGVVISNAYELRLSTQSISFWTFCKIRLVRIYPLYISGVVIAILGMIFGLVETPATHLPAVLLFAVLVLPLPVVGGWPFPLNVPSWSLYLELVANFFYAAILRRLSTPVIAVIVSLSAAGLVVLLRMHHSLDVGFTSFRSLFAGYFRIGYSFFIGVAIYRHYRRRNPPEIRSTPLSWAILALVAILLTVYPPEALNAYYDFLAVTAVFPAVIYFSLRLQPGAASAKIFSFFGAISYALYALHEPTGRFVAGVLSKMHVSVQTYAPVSGLFFLIFLIGLAFALNKIYDMPARTWLLSLQKSDHPAIGSAAPQSTEPEQAVKAGSL